MNFGAWYNTELRWLATKDTIVLIVHRDTINKWKAFLTLKKLVKRIYVREDLQFQVSLVQVYESVFLDLSILILSSIFRCHFQDFVRLFAYITSCFFSTLLAFLFLSHSIDQDKRGLLFLVLCHNHSWLFLHWTLLLLLLLSLLYLFGIIILLDFCLLLFFCLLFDIFIFNLLLFSNYRDWALEFHSKAHLLRFTLIFFAHDAHLVCAFRVQVRIELVERVECNRHVLINEVLVVKLRKFVSVGMQALKETLPVLQLLIALESVGEKTSLWVQIGGLSDLTQTVEAFCSLTIFAKLKKDLCCAGLVTRREKALGSMLIHVNLVE